MAPGICNAWTFTVLVCEVVLHSKRERSRLARRRKTCAVRLRTGRRLAGKARRYVVQFTAKKSFVALNQTAV